MQNDDNDNLPFSQRNGYAEIPPQLKIGVISDEFLHLLEYVIIKEIDKNTKFTYPSGEATFSKNLSAFSKDFYVRFLKQRIIRYKASVKDLRHECSSLITRIMRKDLPILFDFIEFLIKSFTKHDLYTESFKKDLCDVFIEARAAYRIVDDKIMAIGTEEQGKAVKGALDNTEKYGAKAARSHLIESGVALRNGNWADSIRESIHAVESAARLLDKNTKSLGDALKKIEKNGNLHGGLKSAFSALYGYTSDEEGVRHALVYQDTPKVDETDALFMLGACASFVSYLLAKNSQNTT